MEVLYASSSNNSKKRLLTFIIFRNLNEIPSECVSELISHFLALEKVQEEGFVYGVLPVNTPSILPRGKPVPSRKAETRWERFAKEKGTLICKSVSPCTMTLLQTYTTSTNPNLLAL